MVSSPWCTQHTKIMQPLWLCCWIAVQPSTSSILWGIAVINEHCMIYDVSCVSKLQQLVWWRRWQRRRTRQWSYFWGAAPMWTSQPARWCSNNNKSRRVLLIFFLLSRRKEVLCKSLAKRGTMTQLFRWSNTVPIPTVCKWEFLSERSFGIAYLDSFFVLVVIAWRVGQPECPRQSQNTRSCWQNHFIEMTSYVHILGIASKQCWSR